MYSNQRIGGFTCSDLQREQQILSNSKKYFKEKYSKELPKEIEYAKELLENSELECVKCCKTCKNKSQFGKIHSSCFFRREPHYPTGCLLLGIPVSEMWCCKFWKCDDKYSTNQITDVNEDFIVEILDRKQKDKN